MGEIGFEVNRWKIGIMKNCPNFIVCPSIFSLKIKKISDPKGDTFNGIDCTSHLEVITENIQVFTNVKILQM